METIQEKKRDEVSEQPNINSSNIQHNHQEQQHRNESNHPSNGQMLLPTKSETQHENTKEHEESKKDSEQPEEKQAPNHVQEASHELKSSVSHVPHHIRLTNISEIYNVAMSPTSISIAFDTHLKRNVIMKKIFKSKLDELQRKQAILECKVTCQLDHFNLVKGFDCYESAEEYILLMELANDAEYFQEKVENCHTPIKNELKLKSYITDVLNGLEYIHKQGYIHCDLKLANLFCVRSEEEGDDSEIRRVKIGDFGLMQKIDSASGEAYIDETCGTFGFKAPELKKGAYITPKADMWSLGVIMYSLTVAYMPHHMKGYKYGQGEVPFREFDWKKRSPELRDFVSSMLHLNPANRLSASDALKHPFLKID